MTSVSPSTSGGSSVPTATTTQTPAVGLSVGPPAVVFDKVAKTFADGTTALRDVSLSVLRGEFVTVVGPSGCGKSTLLRIASGLDTQSVGTVAIDRSHVGYVFQDATLLPWRTVKGNVELLMELRGVGKEERRDTAQRVIELVGLSGFERHYPKALSGGMRMRVSLARSLALSPPVFLFDEPFGALDEITRERLNEETLALFAQAQFAGLFITHSIAEAVFMSTRVLVMSGRPGHIVANFNVSFDYPRTAELRFDPAFAQLCGEVSEALRASEGGLPSVGGVRQ